MDEAAIPREYILDQPDWKKNKDFFYTKIKDFKLKFIDAVREFVAQTERGEPLDGTAITKTMKSFVWHAKRLAFSKATFDEKHFQRPVLVRGEGERE